MGLCPLLTATPLPGSEFQVQAPSRGSLGRGYVGGRGSEKHSPDSACSVDYSNSRLSSPEHPNEGEALALAWTGGGLLVTAGCRGAAGASLPPAPRLGEHGTPECGWHSLRPGRA